MSAFPPPSNQPPVFNPSLFTTAVTNVIAAVDPDPQAYLEFPVAQGPVSFVSSSNQTTIGANNLAILTNVGTTDNGIIFGANGLVYNGMTGPLGITWSNLATKIEAIASLTQATNATTLNINNTISIQNGETESVPTQTIVISADASGNRLALDGDYGTSGQILTSGGDAGSLSWTTGGGGSVGTLAQVLENGADAAFTNITAVGSIGLQVENDPLADPITIGAGASGNLILLSTNIIDDTLATKQFSGNYLKVSINGVDYSIQLFTPP